MTDCEIDIYGELRKKITRVWLPNVEQLKPDSFELAANRTRIDKTMAVVKLFIERNEKRN